MRFSMGFEGMVRRLLSIVMIASALAVDVAVAEVNGESVQQARQVMDEFMAAFNARDEGRWADTLLFPHVRFASGGVVVHDSKQAFVAGMDFDAFARQNDWDFSEWDDIEVIHAGATKVHFKVRFSRFNPQGQAYATFDSLYILQKVEGRWGIRARSSFAP